MDRKKWRRTEEEAGVAGVVVFARQIRLQTRERSSKAKMMSKGSAISDAARFDYMNINFARARARVSALCAYFLPFLVFSLLSRSLSLSLSLFAFRSTGKYIFPRCGGTDNNNRCERHWCTRRGVFRVYQGTLSLSLSLVETIAFY